VVKGGGFLSSASDCRAAAREKFDAYKESYEIGFRVVIGLPLR
jgi:formylglycine-generating enzyme required for sulfatase activity